MNERDSFVNKLIGRLDRIDRDSLKSCLQDCLEKSALLEEAFHLVPEGILIYESEGKVMFLNSQASYWLGLDGKDIEKLRVPSGIQNSEIRQFFMGLKSSREQEAGIFSVLEPREARLKINLAPLEGKGNGRLVMIQDHSGHESAGQLEDKSAKHDALLSLAAGIAHEIGNPLNAIGIHLHLMKGIAKELPAGKRKDFEESLAVLKAETSRLDQIVKNFLKSARRPPLRFKEEDLNQIISEALRFLDPELKNKKIGAQFKADPALPFCLMDRMRLYQAFINLIKNAMEAMPNGGTLKIGVSHKEKIIFVRIQDSGVGINESELPHIFEAYFTTKEHGSGLGLMFVLSAVQEHGGKIEVASKGGRGTTFLLILPMRQPRLQLPQYKSK